MQEAVAVQSQKNEGYLRFAETRKNAIRYQIFRIKWGLLNGEILLKDAKIMLAELKKRLSFY